MTRNEVTIRPMTNEERHRAKERAMANTDADKERKRQDTTNTPSPDRIVRAALERAADFHDQTFTNPKAKKAYWQSDLIRALANDPAEVAAIISAAAQLNKAGDGNKEQRDEEDRR